MWIAFLRHAAQSLILALLELNESSYYSLYCKSLAGDLTSEMQ